MSTQNVFRSFRTLIVLLFLGNTAAYSQTISGHLTVCLGASRTTLMCGTPGGTWSSADPSRATIDATTGVVTGVSSGTATISYELPSSSFITAVVTVNFQVMSPIGFSMGSASRCTGGATATCTVSPKFGNEWTSSDATIATINTGGLVTPSPMNAGTTIISYRHGTGNCYVTREVTVNTTPTVTATTSMCNGTTQIVTATPGGGSWSSSSTSVGTVNSTTGVMSALAGGGTTIFYTTATGCASSRYITVLALPGAITGTTTLCEGNTSTLASSTSGGTWSSSNTSVATIGTSGIVSALAAGTTTISYTLGSSCARTTVVTVNAGLPSNTGLLTVCTGQTTTLSNATGGGTWSSSAPSKATVVTGTGLVTGIAAGTANISYRVGAGCSSVSVVTVNASLGAISGPGSICAGTSATLTHAVSGGTWSASNANATIGSTSGVLTGVTAGAVVITYSISSGCYKTMSVMVKAVPSAIAGSSTVCMGASTTLSSATGGGTWSSSNTGVATVGSSTGAVTGVSTGTAAITYTITSTGCFAVREQTVNSAPSVTGSLALCIGATSTLSSSTGGGIWTSSNTSVATIGSSSGVLTGVSSGTSTITYTVGGSCVGSTIVTVNTAPSGITGTTSLCVGATTTLSNAAGGGTWSSGNTGVATIGSTSGIVNAVSAGTSVVTYSVGSGCVATVTMTVLETPGSITGLTSVSEGSSTTLGNAVSGGTWASGNMAVATIGSSSGMVSALTVGTSMITYTLSSGCTAGVVLTVTAAVTGDGSCTPQWLPLNGNWRLSPEAYPAPNLDIAIGNCNVPYFVSADTGGFGSDGAVVVQKFDGGKYAQLGAEVSSTGGYYASIAISSDGTPYVVYMDNANSNRATVKKYDGSAWVNVGSAGFSAGRADHTDIAIDNSDMPYVAYADHVNGDKTTVMKFNGSTWVTVGSAGFSSASADHVTLALDGSGAPYASYHLTESSSECEVAKYSGSTWVTLGSVLPGDFPAIAVDSAGTPYVASYSDFGGGDVWKFNGSAWVSTGALGAAEPQCMTIAMGKDNLPWVALNDYDPEIAVEYRVNKVKRYNGASWITVGDVRKAYTDVISLALDANNDPYVCINDANWNHISVVRLEENKWKYMAGTSGIVGGSAGLATAKVAVDAAGTIYMVGPDKSQLHARKYVDGLWQPVKPDNGIEDATFYVPTPFSTALPYQMDMAIDPAGTPFIAYSAMDELPFAIKKFDGSDWVDVGTMEPGSSAYEASLAFNSSGTPYYASTPTLTGPFLELRKLEGSDWVSVAPAIPDAVEGVTNISLVFDPNDTAYVFYRGAPISTGSKGRVLKFDGTTWQIVGGSYCTADASDYNDMAMAPDGTVYIVYSDFAAGWKATVKKLVAGSWVAVGGDGFTPGVAQFTSIAIDNSGTPYVVFKDMSESGKVTVMKFDGSDWVVVGVAGISEIDAVGTSIVIDGNGTPIVSCATGGLSSGYSSTMVMKFESITEIPEGISVCQGARNSLPNHGGGTWSSANTSVAIVSCTGLVTGVAAGTTAITYSYDSCYSLAIVTVNAAPDAGFISGASTVAAGGSITLSATITGGVWSSSNNSIATVGSSSGEVTGTVPGTATIFYTVTSGSCSSYAMHPVTVTTSGGKPGIPVTANSNIVAFSVAPNPSSGTLTVRSGIAASMVMYTVDGRQLQQYEVAKGSNNIQLPSSLSSGVYMLRFKGDDGSVHTLRLVYEP